MRRPGGSCWLWVRAPLVHWPVTTVPSIHKLVDRYQRSLECSDTSRRWAKLLSLLSPQYLRQSQACKSFKTLPSRSSGYDWKVITKHEKAEYSPCDLQEREHHRVADVRSVTYRNGSGTRSGWLAAAPCVANAWRGRPLQPAHLRPQTTHYNNCVQGNHHYTHALYRLHQEQHHPLLPGNNTSRGNGSKRGRGQRDWVRGGVNGRRREEQGKQKERESHLERTIPLNSGKIGYQAREV